MSKTSLEWIKDKADYGRECLVCCGGHKEKHSPLPWSTITKAGTVHYIHGPKGFEGSTLVLQKKEDADFIVHCVNTHGKLVEALEAWWKYDTYPYGNDSKRIHIRDHARGLTKVALTLAEEKP